MICSVCGYGNLDSRDTCRRCGAPLRAAAEKTLGDDAPDDSGIVLELDEEDIAPRAPARPTQDSSAEALRARALTAGDRDPRHASTPGHAAGRTEPAAPAPPPAPAVPPPAPPVPRAATPPAAPPEPEGHSLDVEAVPPGGLAGVRPPHGVGSTAPRPPDTVAGIRRTPPPAAPVGVTVSPAGVAYAGFWVRLLAMVVDWTILTAVLVAAFVAGLVVVGGPGAVLDPTAAATELRTAFSVFEVVLLAFYFGFFTAAAGGTPGKLVLRLKVVRVDGSRVSGGRSVLRFIGYGVELIPGIGIAAVTWVLAAVGSFVLREPLLAATLGTLATFLVFVGYIWTAFDPRKQAWHDKLAGTVVVRTS